MSESGYAVFCGLDVGKVVHHAVALDPGGARLHDAPLPQDEARLRQLFTGLQAHGPVLVVVDQPATIGALPVAVARAVGCQVAYLPGLAMRRMAHLHLGLGPDRRPRRLRDRRGRPHRAAHAAPGRHRRGGASRLEVVIGFDDDRAAEATRLRNRIRGLPTRIDTRGWSGCWGRRWPSPCASR